MRGDFRKLISVALSASVVLSMTGCAFLDKSKDEVLDAAEAYAKNLAACNVSKLVKGTVKDLEDDQDTWTEILDFSEGDLYTEDAASALSAIAGTIKYEIDEESVEATAKKGEGSVEVVFTIADYEALLDDEDLTKIEDFVDAVDDADTKEIEITIEFEKDDDTWLCSNYEDVFEDLYAFTSEEYEFRIPFVECVQGVNWYGCDWELGDSNYTNTTYIEVDLDLDYSQDLDYSEIYYTFEYGGQEIYRGTGSYMATLYTFYDGAPVDSEQDVLAAGAYTITFYDVDDSVIWSGNATVYVEAVATPTPTAAPTPADGDDDGSGYAIIVPGIVQYDYDLSEGDEYYDAFDQDASGWYTSDGSSSSGYYTSSDGEIRFDLYTSEDLGILEYRYMRSDLMIVSDSNDIEDCGFNFASAEPTDDGGYVYHFTLSGDPLESGYYILGTYDPRVTQGLLLIAFAGVT